MTTPDDEQLEQDDAAPEPPGPEVVGQRLKRGREAMGLSQREAASRLMVDIGIISGLEAGGHAELGAPVFVRGHVRRYAQLLGLPVEEVLEQLGVAPGEQRPPLMTHERPREAVDASPRAAGAIILIVVLALVTVSLAWYAKRAGWLERFTATDVVVLESGTAALPARPDGDDAGAASATGTGGESGPQGEEPAADVSADAATAPADVQAGEDATGTPPAAEPVVTTINVVLRFTGDSWIEVRDADGERSMYDLFHAGDTISVETTAPATVFLGNAPVVIVSVDGRPLDFSGRVRRDNTARFVLDAEGELGS